MPVVKAFGSERFEHDRVERLSATRMDIGVEVARIQARFDGAISVVTAIGTALVVVVGVFRVAAGALTPGDLVVFATYARKLNSPLKDIARESTKTSRALARADEIAEVLAADEMLEERPGAYRGERAAGSIEVEGVSFAHAPGRTALDDVSLRIEPGSRVALVGPSGAGKSTLAALIARFYDPTSGRVLIDGRDLRDCRLSWLRDQIGVLLQDTVLFTGTVADNIAYSTRATREEVVQAAKAAAAHGFVTTLPNGYDTELGPQGVGLSGGQRQRIGIARTLLRDPPVLLLDEPTTGLDAESQRHVLDGLGELMRGRTTVLITHSPELWRTADRVVEIDGGRIANGGPRWQPRNIRQVPSLAR
jgi:ATP-binding cassette, subfamily B, bacterial